MLPSGFTVKEPCTLAEEYCPDLQLCCHQATVSTSMLPSGLAEDASFSNILGKMALSAWASASLKPVRSANCGLMLPKVQ